MFETTQVPDFGVSILTLFVWCACDPWSSASRYLFFNILFPFLSDLRSDLGSSSYKVYSIAAASCRCYVNDAIPPCVPARVWSRLYPWTIGNTNSQRRHPVPAETRDADKNRDVSPENKVQSDRVGEMDPPLLVSPPTCVTIARSAKRCLLTGVPVTPAVSPP